MLIIPIQITRFEPSFEDELCRWVTDGHTLSLISSDPGETLTKDLISTWIARAVEGYCMLVNDQLVAFATIGSKEWDLPVGLCEIGHLIVHPQYRRRYYGSMMLYGLLAMIRERGMHAAVAREVPGNIPALRMIEKAGWAPVDETWSAGPFNWYRKECFINIRDGNDNVGGRINRVTKTGWDLPKRIG